MRTDLMITIENATLAPKTGAISVARASNNESARRFCARKTTPVEFPEDKCIHQLIEEQVQRTPNATAVVCENERLTYRELNGRANQLAHRLRKLGVGPD